MHKLTSTERHFFELVSRAAFTNPFSEERKALDREISGSTKKITRDELVDLVMEKVSTEIRKLEKKNATDFGKFQAADQGIMRTSFLFYVFHQYIDQLDELIHKQLHTEEPIAAPFGREAIKKICSYGFSHEVACSYFALYYQLRRSYHFIHQSLIGKSPSMIHLRSRLWNNVFTFDIRQYESHLWNRMEDFSTLILGETGTGKGSAAAAIGRSGYIPYDERKSLFARSFSRSFISFNLSQFPESLIESELFGHRKGAFTGAIDHHEGLFARCFPHGAIFLDEIGDVQPHIQIKLLQILQNRTFSPVGSHDQVRFNGRIIAATNKPLTDLRTQGTFRDDFYYRLCSDVIHMPSLKTRLQEDPDELPLLVEHLTRRITGSSDLTTATTILDRLRLKPGKHYPWPGNVRELEQAIRRILLSNEYPGDETPLLPDKESVLIHRLQSGTINANDLLSTYCKILYERYGTYEEVSKRTELDRRTAKKYVLMERS